MSYRKGYISSPKNVADSSYQGIDFSAHTLDDLKKLWRQVLEKGMHGLCFSMYEENQRPGDTITEEQVRRRLRILEPYTQWVRSFSCIEGNEHVPKVARELGLKTLVGAWLSNDLDANEKEIAALVELAQAGYVDIAAVGNEVLYRNELSLEQLLGYLKHVKEALPQIPVGYVDAYYEFTNHPELVTHSDVILSNCYPYWEGCPQEYAVGHMRQMYAQALAAAQGKKVIITETGWPSKGGGHEAALASKENAMRYFVETQQWVAKKEIDLFYFSSFDEAWKKGDEGEVGAYWGLWDSKEQLKF
ncbi:MAG: glycosyl hydrolase family 17 protein [Bacteroidota bacterium]